MPIVRFLHVGLMILIDLGAFYTAMVLAILFRSHLFPHVSENMLYAQELYWDHLNIRFYWIPLALILTMAYESLYQKRLPFWQETWHIMKAISLAILMVLAFVSLGKLSNDVSRIIIVSLWLGLLILLPLFRCLGKKLLYYLGLWHENVLILGAGDVGQATLKGLEREVTLGYRVIGFLDDDPAKNGSILRTPNGEYKVFGPIKHFQKFASHDEDLDDHYRHALAGPRPGRLDRQRGPALRQPGPRRPGGQGHRPAEHGTAGPVHGAVVLSQDSQ